MTKPGNWTSQAISMAAIIGCSDRADAADTLASALIDAGIPPSMATWLRTSVENGDRTDLRCAADEILGHSDIVGSPLAIAVEMITIGQQTVLGRAESLIRRAIEIAVSGGADNTDIDAWSDLGRTLRTDDLRDLWIAAGERTMSRDARSSAPATTVGGYHDRPRWEALLHILLSETRWHAVSAFSEAARFAGVHAQTLVDLAAGSGEKFLVAPRSIAAAREAMEHPEISQSPYLLAGARLLAIHQSSSDASIVYAIGTAVGLVVAGGGGDGRAAKASQRWEQVLKNIAGIEAGEPRWRGDVWRAVQLPDSDVAGSGGDSDGDDGPPAWVVAAEAYAENQRNAADRRDGAESMTAGMECLLRVMLVHSRLRAARIARWTLRMHFRAVARDLCDALVQSHPDEYVLPVESLNAARDLADAEAVRRDPEMVLALQLLAVGRFCATPDIRTAILRAVTAISGLASSIDGDHRAQKARTIWDSALSRLDDIEAAEPRWRLDMWRAIRKVIRSPSEQDDDIEEIERQAQRLSNMQVSLVSRRAAAEEMAGIEIDDVPEPPGLVVVPKIGSPDVGSGKDVARVFKRITAKRVPLSVAPDDIPSIRGRLVSEAPHAVRAIDMLLGDLRPGRPVRFRPTIILGSPGGGKSRLVRRIAEEVGVAVARVDGAGSSDSAFAGTPRRWSTGEPSFPLLTIYNSGVANPVVMIDEVDKASTSMHNGRLGTALLPFLESETSRRYADPYIMADVDLSAVSYIMTANDDTVLPAPLRDRCRILRIPEPGREHVPALAASVARDIAREMGEDDRMAVLTADEIEIVGRLLGERPSVRRIRAIVERVLAARERAATRH